MTNGMQSMETKLKIIYDVVQLQEIKEALVFYILCNFTKHGQKRNWPVVGSR